MSAKRLLSIGAYALTAICFLTCAVLVSAAEGLSPTKGLEPMVAVGGTVLWGLVAFILVAWGLIKEEVFASVLGLLAALAVAIDIQFITGGMLRAALLLNLIPAVFLFVAGLMLILTAIDLRQGWWDNKLNISP